MLMIESLSCDYSEKHTLGADVDLTSFLVKER